MFKNYNYGNTSITIQSGSTGGAQCYLLFTVRTGLGRLERTLVKFMNDRLQREMDKLWESGEMSNEKLQEMQSEHLRTAYK